MCINTWDESYSRYHPVSRLYHDCCSQCKPGSHSGVTCSVRHRLLTSGVFPYAAGVGNSHIHPNRRKLSADDLLSLTGNEMLLGTFAAFNLLKQSIHKSIAMLVIFT